MSTSRRRRPVTEGNRAKKGFRPREATSRSQHLRWKINKQNAVSGVSSRHKKGLEPLSKQVEKRG